MFRDPLKQEGERQTPSDSWDALQIKGRPWELSKVLTSHSLNSVPIVIVISLSLGKKGWVERTEKCSSVYYKLKTFLWLLQVMHTWESYLIYLMIHQEMGTIALPISWDHMMWGLNWLTHVKHLTVPGTE